MNMGKIVGKVVLIAGGSDGIDLATAQLFVTESAYVFFSEHRKKVPDATVKQIGDKDVRGIVGDSSKFGDIHDNIIKIIKEEKGK
jgi:NAD(P)-dependent dehydrogenase (short-subunit alcohol dehydrogenase family)